MNRPNAQISGASFQTLKPSAFTKNIIRSLFVIAHFSCLSCKESSPQKSSWQDELTPLPQHVSQLPSGVELSKTEGVSIIQHELTTERRQSISSDGYGGRTATATTANLADIIDRWTEFEGWLKLDAQVPQKTYTVKIEAPEGRTYAELAQEAFESVFSLEYTDTVELMDVWVLSKSPDSQLELTPAEDQSTNWGTAQTPGGFGYDFRSGSMETLTEVLMKYLEGGIVFDETNLKGQYKFVLSMNHWEPETAVAAVEKLGLKVTRTKRGIPTLRIDYKKSLSEK